MTDEQAKLKAELIKEMTEIREMGGGETGHMYADGILCKFLIALGHEDLVEIYESIPDMWYA